MTAAQQNPKINPSDPRWHDGVFQTAADEVAEIAHVRSALEARLVTPQQAVNYLSFYIQTLQRVIDAQRSVQSAKGLNNGSKR